MTDQRIRFRKEIKRVGTLPAAVLLGLFTVYLICREADTSGWFGWAAEWDRRVFAWVDGWRGPVPTGLAKLMDFLGSALCQYVLLLAVIPLMVRRKLWKAALVWAVSLTGGWAANLLLKGLFHRERPALEHGVDTFGYSFPSGHAMVSVVFYGMLVYGLLRYGPDVLRRVESTVWLLLAAFLLAMGLSRIYLGVHYASDALAGAAVGFVWLLLWLLPIRPERRG